MEEERAITAFFEQSEDAERAIDRLEELGIGRDRITMVEHRRGPEDPPTRPGEGGGLFGVLQDTVTPNADRGIGRGRTGYLLTVQAGEAQRDWVAEILGRDGTVERDRPAS